MNTPSTPRAMDATTVRRARIVAAATAAGAAFAAVDYPPLELVTVSTPAAVLLLVAGAVAAVAAQVRRPPLLIASGAVLLLAGMLRLVTYGHGTALIGGASSTAALLTALGVAHLGLVSARTNRPAQNGTAGR